MFGRRVAVLGFGALLTFQPAARAQTPTVPVPLAQCPVALPDATVNLTKYYQSGDWAAFQKYAATVVTIAQTTCPQDQAETPETLSMVKGINLAFDYVLLAWVAKNQFAETTLYSAIVHPGVEPYATTLPGAGPGGPRLFQVFVSPLELDTLAAVYLSVRENNPLVAQLPAVAEAIVNPLFASLQALQGDLRAGKIKKARSRAAATVPPFWATISTVTLPFTRAAVAAELRASTFSSSVSIERSARNLAASLKFTQAPFSPCAQTLADRLQQILANRKEECAEKPEECGEMVAADFRMAYESAQCRTPEAEAKVDRAALNAVDEAFRKLVAGLDSKDVNAKLSLKNVPLARFSFGVMTGYLAWAGTKSARAKIDDGTIVADPLNRQIAMVVVNGGFKAYDSTRFSPGTWERHRWFAGVVITPDIGVGGGYSMLIVRGLAVNVGVAIVASPSPAEGESFDAAPVNPKDPLRPTAAGGLFFGASYNFK
jgi:hypothetical protein